MDGISRTDTFIETDGKTEVIRTGKVGGDGKLLLHGHIVSVWDDEKLLEIAVMVAQWHEYS